MKTKYFTEFSLAHVGGKIQGNDCYDLRLDMYIYDSTYLRMTGAGKIKMIFKERLQHKTAKETFNVAFLSNVTAVCS